MRHGSFFRSGMASFRGHKVQEPAGPWLRRAAGPLASWLQTAPGFSSESGPGWWRVGCDGVKPDMNCLSITGDVGSVQEALAQGFESVLRLGRSAIICIAAEHAGAVVEIAGMLPVRVAGMLPHYLIDLHDISADTGDPGVNLVTVDDVDGFVCSMSVLASAFDDPYDDPNGAFRAGLLDDPNFTFRIAMIGEQPASTVVTWREDEIVYITIMATAPEFQKRGIGRHLLGQTLVEERSTGATHAHLVSSDAGAHLYRAIGFRLLANHPLWLYQGASEIGFQVQLAQPEN